MPRSRQLVESRKRGNLRSKKIDRANEKDLQLWTALLQKSPGGTIFHDPVFLSYHGDRFEEHHVAVYKGDAFVGIMPAAIDRSDGKCILKSPYDGCLFATTLDYQDSRAVVEALLRYCRGLGVQVVTITPPPGFYYPVSCEMFAFAMLEQGFRVINSDITSMVPLDPDDLEMKVFTSRARNMARKARKAGAVMRENADLSIYWSLMEKTFERHGSPPTHSKEQYGRLQEIFPGRVTCDVAMVNDRPAAGVRIFKINDLVNMSFYLCSDPELRETQALSLAVYETILKSKRQGFRFFDFGTSTVNMVARENIFTFKESFGAVGRFRNTFRMEL